MGLGFHCKKKRIAIQLDRTYSEDALIMDASFSTPHFITLLIEHGFLKDDVNLPLCRPRLLSWSHRDHQADPDPGGRSYDCDQAGKDGEALPGREEGKSEGLRIGALRK